MSTMSINTDTLELSIPVIIDTLYSLIDQPEYSADAYELFIIAKYYRLWRYTDMDNTTTAICVYLAKGISLDMKHTLYKLLTGNDSPPITIIRDELTNEPSAINVKDNTYNRPLLMIKGIVELAKYDQKVLKTMSKYYTKRMEAAHKVFLSPVFKTRFASIDSCIFYVSKAAPTFASKMLLMTYLAELVGIHATQVYVRVNTDRKTIYERRKSNIIQRTMIRVVNRSGNPSKSSLYALIRNESNMILSVKPDYYNPTRTDLVDMNTISLYQYDVVLPASFKLDINHPSITLFNRLLKESLTHDIFIRDWDKLKAEFNIQFDTYSEYVYDFVMRWLKGVLCGDKPTQKALVISGRQGIGKDTLVNILARIMGKEYIFKNGKLVWSDKDLKHKRIMYFGELHKRGSTTSKTMMKFSKHLNLTITEGDVNVIIISQTPDDIDFVRTDNTRRFIKLIPNPVDMFTHDNVERRAFFKELYEYIKTDPRHIFKYICSEFGDLNPEEEFIFEYHSSLDIIYYRDSRFRKLIDENHFVCKSCANKLLSKYGFDTLRHDTKAIDSNIMTIKRRYNSVCSMCQYSFNQYMVMRKD